MSELTRQDKAQFRQELILISITHQIKVLSALLLALLMVAVVIALQLKGLSAVGVCIIAVFMAAASIGTNANSVSEAKAETHKFKEN